MRGGCVSRRAVAASLCEASRVARRATATVAKLYRRLRPRSAFHRAPKRSIKPLAAWLKKFATTNFPRYGRGGGVGRALGVGVDLGVTLGVPVGVAVGVCVAVAVAVGVAVGVCVAVAVAVGVAVGV